MILGNGKTFILAISILLVIFAFKLVGLYNDIKKGVKKESDLLELSLEEIKRPSKNVVLSEYRNIFGVKGFQETTVKKQNIDKENGVTELFTENKVIRLKGTFITETDKYAVVVMIDKSSRKEEESIKVQEGDKIGHFTVNTIKPGYLVLSGDSSEDIRLKIFEPM